MVRTVADGKKAVGSKAPRKNLGGASRSSAVYASSSGSPSSNNANFGGFNHAKMWPTPSWQKGIGNFFKKSDKPQDEDAGSSSSCNSSEDQDRMDDVVIVTGSNSNGDGSSNSSSGSSGPSMAPRGYSDDEDKENIDPASSPELKENAGRSDSGSPSPKIRRKAHGKQKAGSAKRKKRAVLQEDSDYETEE